VAAPAPCIVDGRFEVASRVGQGGLGTAFRANDRREGGAPALVKVLRAGSDAARSMITAEARALARLAHPAIPPLSDAGRIRSVEGAAPDPCLREGAYYLARAFVDGEDLFAATRGRPLAEALRLAAGLTRALLAVHARGLVHGDVKPGNALVPRAPADPAWPVSLIDFGPGETVEYTSPERLRGRAPDRASDLFALGVTLYRVLSGALPFEGETAGRVARAVLEGSPVPLERRAPEVPAPVAAAVMRLLDRAPLRRAAGAAALLRALGDPMPAEAPGAGGAGSAPPALAALTVSLEASPLAGRDAEEATLSGLMAPGSTRPRALLVTGGAGTGKSRLLAEAALAARLQGLTVVRASGRRADRAFALFAEAFPAVLGADAPLEAAEPSLKADPGAALRALDALAGRILDAASAAPTALLLDDLDRAGEDDRSMAGLLARRLLRAPASPLVLVAGARESTSLPHEVPRILLGDLAPEALPALVRGALGPVVEGEAALLAALRAAGGGNPALLERALRDLARARALEAAPGGLRYSGEAAARMRSGGQTTGPAGHQPTSDLPEGEARLLRALALLGRPAAIDLLAQALDVTADDAYALGRALSARDLAIETEGRFGLAPGAAPPDGDLAGPEGAALATALARAIEAGPDADPALAGRLLARAGRGALALPLLLSAADRARGAHAHALAAALFGEAAAAAPTAEARAPALLGLGRAELARGALKRAAERLAEALPLVAAEERPAALLDLAEALTSTGDGKGALARIAEAQALLGVPAADAGPAPEGPTAGATPRGSGARPRSRSPLPARALLLEGAVHLMSNALPLAEERLRAAVEAAPTPLARSLALGDLAGVHFRRGAVKPAIELLTEAARLALETGDLRARALCHARLGHVVEVAGDRAAARRHQVRSIRLMRRSGDRAALATALANAAFFLRNGGAFRESGRLYLRALRLRRELGVASGRAFMLMNLGQIRTALGRPEAGLRTCRRALRAARATGEPPALMGALSGIAEALTVLGRMADARRVIREIRRREDASPQSYGRARSAWALAHVLLAEGDPKGAALRFRRAEKDFRRMGHPIDIARVHAQISECHRRLAGFAPRDPLTLGLDAHEPSGAQGSAAAPSDESRDEAARGGGAVALERSRTDRLLACASALAVEGDVARLLERVAEDAVALLGAERAFLVLRREDCGLDFAASRNMEQERVLRPESKAPHAIIEAVLAEGRVVASRDALRDGRLKELTSVQMLDVRSVLAVPIRDPSGGVIGALYADHRLRPGGFGDAAERHLEALAAMAAAAVTRARLRLALRARDDEVTTLRAALEASEAARGEIWSGGQTTGPAGASSRPERVAGESKGASASDPTQPAFAAIIGRSDALRSVLDLAARIAPTDLPVLVLGESGTGKELLARAIHLASPRRLRPFVAESCATLPEPLLESALFGHVRGAFTGADRDRAGLFAEAHGGTLFLDEVGETSPAMQAKLLRALQEGEVRPVGGAASRRVDVRVVAATNRDLGRLRAEGRFRDDLFFRLGAVSLTLPPLRDRAGDVLAIAERILEETARRMGRKRIGLDPEAAALLSAHPWPGNVRELEHVLRAAALFAERGRVGVAALRSAGLATAQPGRSAAVAALSAGDASIDPETTYDAFRAGVDARERAFVEAALARAGGNKGRAAAALGLSRFAFLRHLKRLGL